MFRMRIAPVVLAFIGLTGCSITQHTARPARQGRPAATSDIQVTAGPLRFETIVAADWTVDRSGLINLDHPAAAGLSDGKEPIHIAFHAITHPEHGTFLIDTGVERAWTDPVREPAVGSLVQSFMNTDALTVHIDTATWLATHGPITGIWLTHLHLDHVMGLPDVPKDVPLFSGPGEVAHSSFQAMFVQGSMDALLAGFGPIREWRFEPDPSGRFDGVHDIFGDGTAFALWVPGHTAGSLSFLIRSTEGPVLVLGDACHTAWGWTHGVEPGSYSYDQPRSAKSLAKLKRFAAQHPALRVVYGHQPGTDQHAHAQ